MLMDGHWITVGTPDAIPLAEAAVAGGARPRGDDGASPRVFSIPPGAPFLPTLGRGRCSPARWFRTSHSTAIRCRSPTPPSSCRRAAPRANCAASLPKRARRPRRRSCRSSGRSASSTRTRPPSTPRHRRRSSLRRRSRRSSACCGWRRWCAPGSAGCRPMSPPCSRRRWSCRPPPPTPSGWRAISPG